MKSISLSALLIAVATVLAGCGAGTDPIAYLKARDEALPVEVKPVFDSLGYWQAMCGAKDLSRWNEAVQYCASKPVQGILCVQISVIEEARKRGQKDCAVG